MPNADDEVLARFLEITTEVVAENGGDPSNLGHPDDLDAKDKVMMAESLRRFAARSEKALAFDRIADAFNHIPAGWPTPEEHAAAEANVLETVGRAVIALHPNYAGSEARAKLEAGTLTSARR